MPYVPPKYPAEIPSAVDLPDRTNDRDWLYAARYNELKKEIRACLTELGVLPKGSFADVTARLTALALKTNVLQLNNTTPYTPTTDYHPATMKFVLDNIVDDHGNLAGLADDDHSQYHNDARGDSRYLNKENTTPFTPDADYEPATKKYIDDAVIDDHGNLAGLADDDHSLYHNDARGDSRYLNKENTTPFTPDADYEPATKKYIDDLISGIPAIPAGLICIWSGTLANIPTGWALCDGGGGRPNLIDKFVKGIATAGTNPGTLGGAASVTLTASQIPSHKHSISSDGDHTHTIRNSEDVEGGSRAAAASYDAGTITTSSNGAHSHGGDTGLIGGGGSHENRPPYYEVAYIIKT